jgi:predicted DNA repair protein MutK
MASVGLLALIDDIATILDDITLMTKVAAKKTAGVLGDDLALNAQQVSGIDASRELPVVWAVAKGSFINKLILVPAALLISAFLPWLVTPLMMLGGLYLCYEGVEKLAHKFIHEEAEDDAHHNELVHAVTTPEVDIAEFEKSKIKGAIRTDFILSAEIIVISLGVAQGAPILTQTIVVSLIAIAMTIGVYGLVAGIVKFDDAGLALITSAGKDWFTRFKRVMGQTILWIAPKFMKFLSVVGMLAMFLVGGGILVHGMDFLHHWIESIAVTNPIANFMVPQLFNAGVGVVAGALVLAIVLGIKRVLK